MTITYPLSHPTSPGVRRCTFTMRTVTGVASSPFTGQQQVYRWPGAWWQAEIELPQMKRASAEEWIGFLASLKGPYGTFLLGDPDGKIPRGIASGTAVVNGTHAVGAESLNTKQWTVSQTGILKRGDYFQVGSGTAQRLHKVLTDANSGTGGLATFDIFPPLREALADGAAITVGTARGCFRLMSNAQGWGANEMSVYDGITLSAVEAI